MPGSYRITPNAEASFEPLDFAVEAGRETLVAPPSGTLQFRWPGDDLWVINSGQTRVAVHQGTASRVLVPGSYRIAANGDATFDPLECTIEAGRETVAAPPAGSFEFPVAGGRLLGALSRAHPRGRPSEGVGRSARPRRLSHRPHRRRGLRALGLRGQRGSQDGGRPPSGTFEFRGCWEGVLGPLPWGDAGDLALGTFHASGSTRVLPHRAD
jgi:hypothetical protein